MTNFSVLISVYFKENSSFFEKALASIWDGQTLQPTEIVVVKDGELTPELDSVLIDFSKKAPVKVVALSTNVGLGKALAIGLDACSYELVARMDTDDIATSNRFELQINYLIKNPNCFLVGSNIEEFQHQPGDLKSIKRVPEHDTDIKYFLYKRSPFNHPSVVFRKSKIIAVDSYKQMLSFEDYYLWFRLVKSGGNYYNFQEPLLYFRVGNDMIGRRHGLEYALKEFQLFKTLHQEKFISYIQFMKFISVRFPLRIIPKKLLNFIYFKVLR
ncbi:glycosyltransferase [Flavobacterium sp.]|uniref:glycosyltransferase n=1 Tax=Flavobacterium sp. TaxID=239 RepID=UPI001B6994E6|nr:glycosyltransferase [Flavobacterium sp.]MBP6128157.1 glycosyltransferase [Flavobacterium sp.]